MPGRKGDRERGRELKTRRTNVMKRLEARGFPDLRMECGRRDSKNPIPASEFLLNGDDYH